MAELSDTQIRSDLRSLFVEAGVDPNRASMLCASGVVRVLGELLSVHNDAPVPGSKVGELEQSIRRARGVKRVHFHLDAYEQSPTGQWSDVAPRTESERRPDAPSADPAPG